MFIGQAQACWQMATNTLSKFIKHQFLWVAILELKLCEIKVRPHLQFLFMQELKAKRQDFRSFKEAERLHNNRHELMVEGDSKGKDLDLTIVRGTKSFRLSRERRGQGRGRMTSGRYLGVTCIWEKLGKSCIHCE